MKVSPKCFFIMPFNPEFHYLYLYAKNHLENAIDIRCERADESVRTVATWEKIRQMIESADVVVANCTGQNSNVLYELGWAHALDKKVVLITSDAFETVPNDIRPLDFLIYDHQDHEKFLGALTMAISRVLEGDYSEKYREAEAYFAEFSTRCPREEKASLERFTASFRSTELAGQRISITRLLMFVVENSADPQIMEAINEYSPTSGKQILGDLQQQD